MMLHVGIKGVSLVNRVINEWDAGRGLKGSPDQRSGILYMEDCDTSSKFYAACI